MAPWWLSYVVACQGEEKLPPESIPSETSPSTGETGGSTPTGDTGTEPIDVWPLCDHMGRTESVTLLGEDRLDAAGHSVDAGDIDGDGCAELAVAATWEGDYEPGEGTVYLVTTDGLTSGSLGDVASALWQEPDAGNWVSRVALAPPQVAWLAAWGERDSEDVLTNFQVLAYDLPSAPSSSRIGGVERDGDVHNPGGYHQTANDIEDCSGMGSPTLCVGSASRGPEPDFAGSIALYDLPLQGSISMLDFRTRLYGHGGENAQMVEADDLDGDGLDDLAVGAFYAAKSGRVGLVSAPEPGELLLWDASWATFEGVVPLGHVGLGLATGDLDGDGHTDLMVGAPTEDTGYAYIMLGPFSGSTSVTEAHVTVQGEPGQWTGYDGAIGDMTGDGTAELAVGAPYSIYFGPAPGQVAVFSDPSPGTYLVSEAPTLLTSGSPDPDAFGIAIAPADFDGDGLLDLAIGASNDRRAARQAGSVTLVFGASL